MREIEGNSVSTNETPHYPKIKGCSFIVIRQLNPVDTHRDNSHFRLKTIIPGQLTATKGLSRVVGELK